MYGHGAWETGGHLVGARLLLEKGTYYVARRWDPWYLTRYPVTILGSSGVPHWVFCIEVLRIESARRAYAYGFTSPTYVYHFCDRSQTLSGHISISKRGASKSYAAIDRAPGTLTTSQVSYIKALADRCK